MTKEEISKLMEEDLKEKEEYLDSLPEDERKELESDGEFWDAHSCSRFANDDGYCQFCGAVVYGSYAYLDLYGGE